MALVRGGESWLGEGERVLALESRVGLGPRDALKKYPTLKVSKGSGEEIPLIQGKEQWLCFAGAAVKRYPTPKVRETQVRR